MYKALKVFTKFFLKILIFIGSTHVAEIVFFYALTARIKCLAIPLYKHFPIAARLACTYFIFGSVEIAEKSMLSRFIKLPRFGISEMSYL